MAAAKAWAAAPWNAARTGTTGAMMTGLVVALWLGVRLIRWHRGRRPSRGRFDPVRREAGRWLGQLRQKSTGGARRPDEDELLDELQRVRFGRRETWPEPRAVFRRARRWKKKT